MDDVVKEGVEAFIAGDDRKTTPYGGYHCGDFVVWDGKKYERWNWGWHMAAIIAEYGGELLAHGMEWPVTMHGEFRMGKIDREKHTHFPRTDQTAEPIPPGLGKRIGFEKDADGKIKAVWLGKIDD